MIKLFRKLKYGDSSKTPIFISRKNKWLYKNKWITDSLAISIISETHLQYTYSIGVRGCCIVYQTECFYDVLSKAAHYPDKITFLNPSQFSVQELKVLNSIRLNAAKTKIKDFERAINEIDKQIKDLNI